MLAAALVANFNIVSFAADAVVHDDSEYSAAVQAANEAEGMYVIEVAGDITRGATFSGDVTVMGSEGTKPTTGSMTFEGGALKQAIVKDITFAPGAGITNNSGWDPELGQHLTLDNVTITNNASEAISNTSKLTIQNGCSFDGNTARSNGGGAILNIGNDSTLDISDSSFTNNQAVGSSGGAINNIGSADITIKDTTFAGNQCTYYGGAVHTGSGEVNITGGIFNENHADAGGALYNTGGTTNITDSIFTGNYTNGTSAPSSYGGAIKSVGILNITDTIFDGNHATSGGAIDTAGTTTITRGEFKNNYAIGYGGGAISSDGALTIDGTKFTENHATDEGGNGGAINAGSALTIKGGAEFTGNTAGESGGAISGTSIKLDDATFTGNIAYAGNGGAISGSFAQLDNATFVDNHADNAYGGAIYMSGGDLTVNNVNFEGNSAFYGGAIFNWNDLTITGNSSFTNNTATAGGAIFTIGNLNLNTDAGDIIFSGNIATDMNSRGADIYMNAVESTTVNITGDTGTLYMDGGFSGLGTINKTGDGDFIIGGDSSYYDGIFNSNAGTTTVTGLFFGGLSNFNDGGTVNWETAQAKDGYASINAVGGNLNVGTLGMSEGGAVLYLNNPGYTDVPMTDEYGAEVLMDFQRDLIDDAVVVNVAQDSGIVNYGDVTLGSDDTYEGFLDNHGLLTINGTVNNPSLTGSLIQNDAGAVTRVVNESILHIGLNAIITQGTIDIGNGGTGCSMEVSNGVQTYIGADVIILNGDDNTMHIAGGTTIINGNDVMAGDIIMRATEKSPGDGTLIVDGIVENTGKLECDTGTLGIISGNLDVADESYIKSGTNTHITTQGILSNCGGDTTLDNTDSWAGTINLTDGTVTLDNHSNSAASCYVQSGGLLTVTNESNMTLGENSSITDGDITIINDSVMHINQQTITSAGTNVVLDNGHINSVDGILTNHDFGEGTLSSTHSSPTTGANPGIANFMVDVNGTNFASDTFSFETINGNINVSNFNFLYEPSAREFDIPVFYAENIRGGEQLDGSVPPETLASLIEPYADTTDPTFTASQSYIMAPVGRYSIESYNNGVYGFRMDGYNPQVFRGQAATGAMYSSQLAMNSVLFDHVYVDSYEPVARGRKNQYASGTGMFAPFQFDQLNGGLWAKSYVNFEKLHMTGGLDIGNNLYGQIVGADFCPMELGNGWKFIPTAFIAYNGGHQYFNGVSMYQNGGQGGFLGTFAKEDFITSIMAYAGGYSNQMSVAGATDKTGNWFAGTAAKAAYNFHPHRHWTLQPSALVAYNVFGEQNWNSSFGSLSMNSGMLNGINVAPGLNLIYGNCAEWNLYLTTMYMFNINDEISGSAGGKNLPKVSMRHGYFEYGVGGTKTFNERLVSWAQVTVRNGGRTGVALQAGLEWKF